MFRSLIGSSLWWPWKLPDLSVLKYELSANLFLFVSLVFCLLCVLRPYALCLFCNGRLFCTSQVMVQDIPHCHCHWCIRIRDCSQDGLKTQTSSSKLRPSFLLLFFFVLRCWVSLFFLPSIILLVDSQKVGFRKSQLAGCWRQIRSQMKMFRSTTCMEGCIFVRECVADDQCISLLSTLS